jgi:hypothetical protein
MQHKLAARATPVGGDDGGLHAELVRCAGLALADALHLRRMEGIELSAALALLLRADLRGAAERKCERLLESRLSFDLATDMTLKAAKPCNLERPLAQIEIPVQWLGSSSRTTYSDDRWGSRHRPLRRSQAV